MKKTIVLVLLLLSIMALPVVASEQSTYWAYDAYELKNGSTPWSFQHATIGQDDYSDLEFIESGWYYEFYMNWAYGSWHYGYINNGRKISAHAGMVCDPVLTFTAPCNGEIQIPSFTAFHNTESGDGVNFQILKKI